MGAAPSHPSFAYQYPVREKKKKNTHTHIQMYSIPTARFNLIRSVPVAGSEGLRNREPILIGSLHCTGVNIFS